MRSCSQAHARGALHACVPLSSTGCCTAPTLALSRAQYVTDANIKASPAITFLWVKTFPLKIYGPLVLPLLIVFMITSIETVGDVNATEEASYLATSGPAHDRRTRGALLNDGVSGIFAALATSMPMTTFAQNNVSRPVSTTVHAGFALDPGCRPGQPDAAAKLPWLARPPPARARPPSATADDACMHASS